MKSENKNAVIIKVAKAEEQRLCEIQEISKKALETYFNLYKSDGLTAEKIEHIIKFIDELIDNEIHYLNESPADYIDIYREDRISLLIESSTI